ncbi:MAG: glycoside hydrolase family protein [Planctomycetota bacterium]
MTTFRRSVLLGMFLLHLGDDTNPSPAAESPSPRQSRNDLLERARFIQIPGPNPILTPGSEGAWDGQIIEAADALSDFGTYYLYYHGNGGEGYQVGVATSSHPLGPFKKHGDKPVLERGPPGSWDDRHVACAMVLKEGVRKYLMWYSAKGSSEEYRTWSIGLAMADNPLGPWKKYPRNPIIEDFGYVGGVVQADGKYWLYTAYPIGSTGPDYSPMALATADQPEGPWTIYPHNPVLKQGEWGEWDDGGFSEAEVLYHSGVFHMFYGGAKLYTPRILTRESIGYAYSFDGMNFVKYGRNPVATREAEPNAAAYAEVHSILEPPFIYIYHTLRYRKPWRERFKPQFPLVEDLGVQVLVLQRPFSLDMPVLHLPSLPGGRTTGLSGSSSVALSQVTRAALTAECACGEKAQRGIRIHVRSSPDGLIYDTTDLSTFDVKPEPGRTCRQTFKLDHNVRFIKVLVENLDSSESVSDVKVTITLGGY